MKAIDRFLQNWRIRKAKRFINPNASILDIGSVDGILFNKLNGNFSKGVGIDPLADTALSQGKVTLLRGFFPDVLPNDEKFDVITMLAVLEHIPPAQQKPLAENCAKYLQKGGHLIITVPSEMVDYILAVLKFFRLIDGMSLEEHYGFQPKDTLSIFKENFDLVEHSTFQLGLNNLFVFRRR